MSHADLLSENNACGQTLVSACFSWCFVVVWGVGVLPLHCSHTTVVGVTVASLCTWKRHHCGAVASEQELACSIHWRGHSL